jgi:hypothetical protein
MGFKAELGFHPERSMRKTNPSLLPPNILERIDPKDRPAGRAGWTRSESQEKSTRRQEIPEQKTFASWLNLKGHLYYQSRSDKRPTFRTGASDFTIYAKSKTLFLEFKAPGATQSHDPIEFEREVLRAGHTYRIVYSAQEAIELCRAFFD